LFGLTFLVPIDLGAPQQPVRQTRHRIGLAAEEGANEEWNGRFRDDVIRSCAG